MAGSLYLTISWVGVFEIAFTTPPIPGMLKGMRNKAINRFTLKALLPLKLKYSAIQIKNIISVIAISVQAG